MGQGPHVHLSVPARCCVIRPLPGEAPVALLATLWITARYLLRSVSAEPCSGGAVSAEQGEVRVEITARKSWGFPLFARALPRRV